MRVMLSQLLEDVSEATRARMLDVLRADVTAHRASMALEHSQDEATHPDGMLLFLSDNMPLLLACADTHRDSVINGLLDAYELQSQPGAHPCPFFPSPSRHAVITHAWPQSCYFTDEPVCGMFVPFLLPPRVPALANDRCVGISGSGDATV